ncbi:MAG: GTP cyclohydrolase II [Alphaproteobacteria bacterium]
MSEGLAGLPNETRAIRAAEELACARPVAVGDASGAYLVLATEHLNSARLSALHAAGPLTLLLSRQRAAHLRLRLYTPDAAGLLVEPGWDAAFIAGLADPSRDLDQPLHGPLAASREPLAPALLAALRLARIAGTLPSAVGAKLSGAPSAFAEREGFLLIEAGHVPELSAFDDPGPLEAQLVTQARLPVEGAANAQLIAFRARPKGLWGEAEETEPHYALMIGTPDPASAPLVRLHSECFTGDLLGSLKCDCGDQLRGAIARIAEEGAGVLLYLRQEGRGIGLLNKLRAYHLQDQGVDTVEANERLGFAEDERSFRPAIRMLEALDFKRVRLLTNNPRKVEALKAGGIEVAERVGHSFPANPHNAHYLATKRTKSGHFL